jgi:hypothetical protein
VRVQLAQRTMQSAWISASSPGCNTRPPPLTSSADLDGRPDPPSPGTILTDSRLTRWEPTPCICPASTAVTRWARASGGSAVSTARGDAPHTAGRRPRVHNFRTYVPRSSASTSPGSEPAGTRRRPVRRRPGSTAFGQLVLTSA